MTQYCDKITDKISSSCAQIKTCPAIFFLLNLMFIFRGGVGLSPTFSSFIVRRLTSRAKNGDSFQSKSHLLKRMMSPTEESKVVSCPLPFETLPYRGASVRLDKSDDSLPTSNEEFLNQLLASLDFWKENDYTSAWLHVPTSRASLIESLQQDAADDDNQDEISIPFDLHHVNATENTIVLKKWLRPHPSEDKIPPFATHQVGCAGFVLSEDNELLLVKEWTGSPSNRTQTKQWKLPGGLLDAGETFGEASCREVFEETGVECEFESILAFWHRHGLMFGKSDFYYVCLLKPKQKEINIDPVEVSDAIWMPIHEFIETQNHPLIHHVLKNVFHLDKDHPPSSQDLREQRTRLEPAIEMLEGGVQFGPERPIYPTYTGRSERGQQQEQLKRR